MANIASRSALLLLLLAASSSPQVKPGQCGHDRWAVKTLTDRDRRRVDLAPVETTISKLIAVRIHEIPYPEDARIEPEELKVYRLRATLIEVRHEQDSDLHLLLADPDNSVARMVAEIPAPECARGSGFEERFVTARRLIASLSLPALVEVTGVGFWDYIHGQDVKGSARNGFELHPVLNIQK